MNSIAACLWLSAGLGMSVGGGYFDLAIVATVIGFAGLILFNLFEKKLARDDYRNLQVITDMNNDIRPLIDLIKDRNCKIMHQDTEMDYESKKMIVKFNVRISRKGISDTLADELIPAIEKAGLPLYQLKWYSV